MLASVLEAVGDQAETPPTTSSDDAGARISGRLALAVGGRYRTSQFGWSETYTARPPQGSPCRHSNTLTVRPSSSNTSRPSASVHTKRFHGAL